MASPFPAPAHGSGLPSGVMVAHLATLPGVQRVPSRELELFVRRNFLNERSCAGLIELIDAKRRPSTIANANGDAAFRTSETCDLDAGEPLVAALEQVIAGFTGLDPVYGEPIQGQRYAVGQEFKGHTDYFEPDSLDYDRYCSIAGNRTWTLMIYLNTPQVGGATRFTAIDKIIHPELGKLVCWNNRRADGAPNPATIHQGMKVRAGVKYIVTKWFRERPWG